MNNLTKALGIGGFALLSALAPKAQAQNNNDFEISPISYFEAGIAYEKSFSSNKKDTTNALIAINYFERYYTSAPYGPHACTSLLRKARLLYEIGRDKDSQSELNRVKQLECSGLYKNAIKIYENLIKRRGSISTQ